MLDVENHADPAFAGQITLVGEWDAPLCNGKLSCYGETFYHDDGLNKGDNAVTFDPQLAFHGQYRLYMSFVASSSRSRATPVDITTLWGTSTVVVNQRQSVDPDIGYYDLGLFPMAPGQGQVHMNTTGTEWRVVVDTFRWVCEQPNTPPPTTTSPTRSPTTSPTTSPTVSPPPSAAPTPAPTFPVDATRVGFIGDSITKGLGLPSDKRPFPNLLSSWLGTDDEFAVANFGISGSTWLFNSDKPYVETTAWPRAQAMDAHIYVVS